MKISHQRRMIGCWAGANAKMYPYRIKRGSINSLSVGRIEKTQPSNCAFLGVDDAIELQQETPALEKED
jgi:hypothetical protein